MLVAYVVVKGIATYTVARVFGSPNMAALHRTAMFAQGDHAADPAAVGPAVEAHRVDRRGRGAVRVAQVLIIGFGRFGQVALQLILARGAQGLRALGCSELEVSDTLEDIRRRDSERLDLQMQGDFMAGRDHFLTAPVPEPLKRVQGVPFDRGQTRRESAA